MGVIFDLKARGVFVKNIFLVVLLVGSFAQSSTMCLNYFSNGPVLDVQIQILDQLDRLQLNMKNRPSGAMLGGDSSRLAKFIMDASQKALAKTVQDVLAMTNLEQVESIKKSVLAINETLNAGYRNATALDLQVLQAYRDVMLKFDRQERIRLAEEILGESLPDIIITYFEHISEVTGKSFKRVIEKHYQLKYQFKLLDSHSPDITMMALLTNFAVQTQNPASIANIYSISEFKVLKKYGKVPESMRLTLVLSYMAEHLNFHVEKTYDFYFQLRSGITQGQNPVLMLPGPQ